MFVQVTVLLTALALAFGSPIDSHATSYVSNSFGAQGNLGGSNSNYGGHVISSPSISHHQIPIVHKVISPIYKHVEYQEEEHAPAEYEFHYAVEDKHTGDIKSQREARHGDAVQGEYSLKEADGTTRIVKYSADKKSGFNAVVIREGHAAHPQVVQKKVEIKKVLVPVVDHHDDYQQIFSHY